MDEQKEKQNATKKRSALPIYAIGIVWLLYAGKLNTFRGILSCAVVSAIVYAILRIVLPGTRRSSCLAMMRIIFFSGRASRIQMGSAMPEWLAQKMQLPAGICSRPVT